MSLMNLTDLFFFSILCLVSSGFSRSREVAASPYFDVMNHGATGDGTTDDSQAFLKSWNAACHVESKETQINIPEKTFFLNPVEFKGPCKASVVYVQVSGKLVASTCKSQYRVSFIRFLNVAGLVLTGTGTIDAQGASWWSSTGYLRPAALDFYHCPNLRLHGLTHINAAKAHVILTGCHGAVISNLNINAPEDSPNTDGIDIGDSTNVRVMDSNIATGDDCIEISAGSSHISITGVTCGPGHGISIGSLGDPGSKGFDRVTNVHVRNCTFKGQDTTGVRIKTWKGGNGLVKKIRYDDIIVDDIRYPIVIDQVYCPNNVCENHTGSGVFGIRDISYTGIRGTSSGDGVISLVCNGAAGCTNIVLKDIDIRSSDPSKQVYANCFNVHGRSRNVEPSVNRCLSH